jgi:pimeloyl-ACP methyl ester carboxylesterase
MGLPDTPATSWAAGELSRGNALDIAEAGRELGRYDARPWLASLGIPASVIVTADDDLVPPRKQRELATLLNAPVHEVPGRHTAVTLQAEPFAAALREALAEVAAARVG